MHPTRLNLLSPEKRTYLQHLVYVQFAKGMIESCLFILATLGIVFLGADWVLQNHFTSLASSLASVASQQAEKNGRLKEINEIIARTDLLQRHYTAWSATITDIANAVPAGMVLSGMSIDRREKHIEFSGTAETRSELLAFQKHLKSLSSIAEVTIPLSQLTSRENFSFTFSATLK